MCQEIKEIKWGEGEEPVKWEKGPSPGYCQGTSCWIPQICPSGYTLPKKVNNNNMKIQVLGQSLEANLLVSLPQVIV